MRNAPSAAGTGKSWTAGASPKLRTANARIPALVFPCLPRCSGLARRLAAVRCGAPGVRPAAQFVPVRFGQIDAVVFGCLLDIRERQFAFFVRNVDRLIEPRDRVPDVTGVG